VPEVARLASEPSGLSPHVAAPLRGALLECCEELQGAEFAARAWSGEASAIELPSDAVFRAWLARRIAPELAAASDLRAQRRAASLERPARRGACLVPSPARGDPFSGGFGSKACE